jgi:hypothetical protein
MPAKSRTDITIIKVARADRTIKYASKIDKN